MINKLSIKNFKSIKELEFHPKRINVFLGAPNVGKSNILEALGLFSVPYINNSENKFENIIRFDSLNNLFYDNNPSKKIEVTTNIASAQLRYRDNIDFFDLFISKNLLADEEFEYNSTYSNFITKLKNIYNKHPSTFDSDDIKLYFNNFNITGQEFQIDQISNYYSSIRKYTFNKNTIGKQRFHMYLLPPDGNNLITIIQKNKELFDEIASFFEIYGLDIMYDVEKNIYEIIKREGNIFYRYPYKLMADTLQRIIFYLTVVETNKNSTILLEEPETHSYPPYTKMLAERIADNETNQFFITTHSPYLLHNILENTKFEDRNIIIAYYENYQTKIKILNEEDITEIQEDDIEVFFNLEKFINNE